MSCLCAGGFRERHDAPAVRAVDPAAALRGRAGGGRRLQRHAAARGRARLRQRPQDHALAAVTGKPLYKKGLGMCTECKICKSKLHILRTADFVNCTFASNPTRSLPRIFTFFFHSVYSQFH